MDTNGTQQAQPLGHLFRIFKYVNHKMGIIKAMSPTALHFPAAQWVEILFKEQFLFLI